jgi:hypothetical protein
MKTWFVSAIVMLAVVITARAEPSVAEQIAAIDAGGYGLAKQQNVIRVQALLNQITAHYHLTEIEVSDKVVFGVHKLLRDKYGISQRLQDTMEDLNRVVFPEPRNGDFVKLFTIYVQMRNAGQPREEVIKRLNAAFILDPRALDVLLDQ